MSATNETKTECSILLKVFELPIERKFEVYNLLKLAQRHARLIEVSLTKKLSATKTEELESIEGNIRAMADYLSLGVSFEQRPNGYTVRLHKNNIFNTLGGSQNGYGIGAPKQL